MTTIAAKDRVNIIDQTVATLANKELVYILGEDPGGFIAKKFPAHPGYAFVVEWFKTEHERVRSFKLLDNGQIYESAGIFEQTALFDIFEEAKAAAEEFQCRAEVGTTIPMKWEVGTLAPPKADWRGK